MSDQSEKEKPKYESPIVVPLGEMAKGTGAYCAAGGTPMPPGNYCAEGTITVSGSPGYCEAGGTASPGYCTAGTTAETACTAGGNRNT